MGIITISSYAHDADKAYFEIYQSKNELLIKAEFPWTIRTALFRYDTTLQHKKNSKEDLEVTLLEYLRNNIQIKDESQTFFKLKSIKELPKGHGHSCIYLLDFVGLSGVFEIKNTCMFGLNKGQVNYHVLESESDKKIRFETTADQVSYVLEIKRNNIYFKVLAAILGIGVFILLFYLFISKMKQS